MFNPESYNPLLRRKPGQNYFSQGSGYAPAAPTEPENADQPTQQGQTQGAQSEMAAPAADPNKREWQPFSAASGLSAIGNLLSLPSSTAMDMLTWLPGGTESQNAFDQWADPFGVYADQNRVSGRQVLRDHGMISQKDTWANFAGSFALESVFDPTTYMGMGAANRAGAALQKAGVTSKGMKKLVKEMAERSGKTTNRGGLGAWYRMSPKDFFDEVKKTRDGIIKKNETKRNKWLKKDGEDSVFESMEELPKDAPKDAFAVVDDGREYRAVRWSEDDGTWVPYREMSQDIANDLGGTAFPMSQRKLLNDFRAQYKNRYKRDIDLGSDEFVKKPMASYISYGKPFHTQGNPILQNPNPKASMDRWISNRKDATLNNAASAAADAAARNPGAATAAGRAASDAVDAAAPGAVDAATMSADEARAAAREATGAFTNRDLFFLKVSEYLGHEAAQTVDQPFSSMVKFMADGQGISEEDIWSRIDIGVARQADEAAEEGLTQGALRRGKKARGKIDFDDLNAKITLFEEGDFTTLVHEFGHFARANLPTAELKRAETGIKKILDSGINKQPLLDESGNWSIAAEEAFARALERYFIDNVVPAPELKSVFDKIKKLMLDVYRSLQGRARTLKINDDIKKLFDDMVTYDRGPAAVSKEAAEDAAQAAANKTARKADAQLGEELKLDQYQPQGQIRRSEREGIFVDETGSIIQPLNDNYTAWAKVPGQVGDLPDDLEDVTDFSTLPNPGVASQRRTPNAGAGQQAAEGSGPQQLNIPEDIEIEATPLIERAWLLGGLRNPKRVPEFARKLEKIRETGGDKQALQDLINEYTPDEILESAEATAEKIKSLGGLQTKEEYDEFIQVFKEAEDNPSGPETLKDVVERHLPPRLNLDDAVEDGERLFANKVSIAEQKRVVNRGEYSPKELGLEELEKIQASAGTKELDEDALIRQMQEIGALQSEVEVHRFYSQLLKGDDVSQARWLEKTVNRFLPRGVSLRGVEKAKPKTPSANPLANQARAGSRQTQGGAQPAASAVEQTAETAGRNVETPTQRTPLSESFEEDQANYYYRPELQQEADRAAQRLKAIGGLKSPQDDAEFTRQYLDISSGKITDKTLKDLTDEFTPPEAFTGTAEDAAREIQKAGGLKLPGQKRDFKQEFNEIISGANTSQTIDDLIDRYMPNDEPGLDLGSISRMEQPDPAVLRPGRQPTQAATNPLAARARAGTQQRQGRAQPAASTAEQTAETAGKNVETPVASTTDDTDIQTILQGNTLGHKKARELHSQGYLSDQGQLEDFIKNINFANDKLKGRQQQTAINTHIHFAKQKPASNVARDAATETAEQAASPNVAREMPEQAANADMVQETAEDTGGYKSASDDINKQQEAIEEQILENGGDGKEILNAFKQDPDGMFGMGGRVETELRSVVEDLGLSATDARNFTKILRNKIEGNAGEAAEAVADMPEQALSKAADMSEEDLLKQIDDPDLIDTYQKFKANPEGTSPGGTPYADDLTDGFEAYLNLSGEDAGSLVERLKQKFSQANVQATASEAAEMAGEAAADAVAEDITAILSKIKDGHHSRKNVLDNLTPGQQAAIDKAVEDGFLKKSTKNTKDGVVDAYQRVSGKDLGEYIERLRTTEASDEIPASATDDIAEAAEESVESMDNMSQGASQLGSINEDGIEALERIAKNKTNASFNRASADVLKLLEDAANQGLVKKVNSKDGVKYKTGNKEALRKFIDSQRSNPVETNTNPYVHYAPKKLNRPVEPSDLEHPEASLMNQSELEAAYKLEQQMNMVFDDIVDMKDFVGPLTRDQIDYLNRQQKIWDDLQEEYIGVTGVYDPIDVSQFDIPANTRAAIKRTQRETQREAILGGLPEQILPTNPLLQTAQRKTPRTRTPKAQGNIPKLRRKNNEQTWESTPGDNRGAINRMLYMARNTPEPPLDTPYYTKTVRALEEQGDTIQEVFGEIDESTRGKIQKLLTEPMEGDETLKTAKSIVKNRSLAMDMLEEFTRENFFKGQMTPEREKMFALKIRRYMQDAKDARNASRRSKPKKGEQPELFKQSEMAPVAGDAARAVRDKDVRQHLVNQSVVPQVKNIVENVINQVDLDIKPSYTSGPDISRIVLSNTFASSSQDVIEAIHDTLMRNPTYEKIIKNADEAIAKAKAKNLFDEPPEHTTALYPVTPAGQRLKQNVKRSILKNVDEAAEEVSDKNLDNAFDEVKRAFEHNGSTKSNINQSASSLDDFIKNGKRIPVADTELNQQALGVYQSLKSKASSIKNRMLRDAGIDGDMPVDAIDFDNLKVDTDLASKLDETVTEMNNLAQKMYQSVVKLGIGKIRQTAKARGVVIPATDELGSIYTDFVRQLDEKTYSDTQTIAGLITNAAKNVVRNEMRGGSSRLVRAYDEATGEFVARSTPGARTMETKRVKNQSALGREDQENLFTKRDTYDQKAEMRQSAARRQAEAALTALELTQEERTVLEMAGGLLNTPTMTYDKVAEAIGKKGDAKAAHRIHSRAILKLRDMEATRAEVEAARRKDILSPPEDPRTAENILELRAKNRHILKETGDIYPEDAFKILQQIPKEIKNGEIRRIFTFEPKTKAGDNKTFIGEFSRMFGEELKGTNRTVGKLKEIIEKHWQPTKQDKANDVAYGNFVMKRLEEIADHGTARTKKMRRTFYQMEDALDGNRGFARQIAHNAKSQFKKVLSNISDKGVAEAMVEAADIGANLYHSSILGRQFARMFDYQVAGSFDEEAQAIGRLRAEATEKAVYTAREAMAGVTRSVAKSGILDHNKLAMKLRKSNNLSPAEAAERAVEIMNERNDQISKYLEGLSPKLDHMKFDSKKDAEELEGYLNVIRSMLPERLQREIAAGVDIHDLDDSFVEYFPRNVNQFSMPSVANDRNRMMMDARFDSMKTRKIWTREIPGGRAVLNELSMDPNVSGRYWSQEILGQGVEEKLINEMVDYAKTKEDLLPRLLPEDMMEETPVGFVPTQEGEKRLSEIVSAVSQLDPKYAKEKIPMYGNNFLYDFVKRVQSGVEKEGVALAVQDLASSNLRVDGASQWSVAKLFSDVGLDNHGSYRNVIRKAGHAEPYEQYMLGRFQDDLDRMAEGETLKGINSEIYQLEDGRYEILSKLENDQDAATKIIPPDKLEETLEQYRGYAKQYTINEKFAVNETVFTEATRFLRPWNQPEEMSEINRAAKTLLNLFKGFVTVPFLNFHSRNFISGQVMNFFFDAKDPTAARPFQYLRPIKDAFTLRSGKTIKGLYKRLPDNIREDIDRWKLTQNQADGTRLGTEDADEIATQYIQDQVFKYGLIGDKQGYAAEQLGDAVESVTSQYPGVGKDTRVGYGGIFRRPRVGASWGEMANPLRTRGGGLPKKTDDGKYIWGEFKETDFAWSRGGEDLAELTEEINRISPFIAYLSQGISPEEAAKTVQRIQIDYSKLSETEKLIRNFVPFYTFSAKMAPVVLQDILSKPSGKQALAVRAASKRGGDDKTAPDYIQEAAAIPLGRREDGSDTYITGLGLAFEDTASLGGFLQGDFQGTFQELGSRLRPDLTGSVEALTGRSLFFDRPVADLDPPIGRTLNNIREMAGGEKLEGSPEPFISDEFEFLQSKLPTSRLVNTIRGLTDTRKDIGSKALNALTGVNITDVSPEMRNRINIDRAGEQLKELGGMTAEIPMMPAWQLERLSQQDRQTAEGAKELIRRMQRENRARKRAEEAQELAEALNNNTSE